MLRNSSGASVLMKGLVVIRLVPHLPESERDAALHDTLAAIRA